MLTSVASILADYANKSKAYTSGGNLNIWSDPEKIGRGKDYIIKTVKNGTDLGAITETGKNKAGVKWGYVPRYGGYVRLGYVAKLGPKTTDPVDAVPDGYPVKVKVVTKGGGPLGIWVTPDKIGCGKIYKVDSVKNGDYIESVMYLKELQADGKYKALPYAAVLDKDGSVIGYVNADLIYASPAAKKAAKEKAEAAEAAKEKAEELIESEKSAEEPAEEPTEGTPSPPSSEPLPSGAYGPLSSGAYESLPSEAYGPLSSGAYESLPSEAYGPLSSGAYEPIPEP